MTVQLNGPGNLADRLSMILNKAKELNHNHVVLLTQKLWHMDVFDFFLKHKSISRLKIKNDMIFMIKDMRIEIKSIDYQI